MNVKLLKLKLRDEYPSLYSFASGCKRIFKIILKITRSIMIVFGSKYIIANVYGSYNFGDALSPILIETLSGKRVVQAYKIVNIYGKPIYSVIGSILDNSNCSNHWIWGSGFISETGKLHRRPKRVLAVRGPLSRKKLLEYGVECPEVYGDPALLCPLLYEPNVIKKYRLGIIPHYIDKDNSALNKFKDLKEVTIIDIKSNLKDVIDHVNECEAIASSSLHGLIIADAYGVPSVWLKLSDKIIGGEFKFIDYFSSVHKSKMHPLIVDDFTTVEKIISEVDMSKIDINLNALIETCPFLRKEVIKDYDIKKLGELFIQNITK